jgi:transposase
VWQVLVDSSLELVLANAAQVKNVPGRKSDVKDATWLSELLAHGLVRASFVPEPAIQQLLSSQKFRTMSLSASLAR